MRVLGFGNFHFSAGVITKRGYFDRFFGNSLFFRFFQKLYHFLICSDMIIIIMKNF